MEIPALVILIFLGGISLAIIGSILSQKFINHRPIHKRRMYLAIVFFSSIVLMGIIALFSDTPIIELIKELKIMLILFVLVFFYSFFIDPIIRRKKGTE